MSHLRVLVCRVEDDETEQMTELARIDHRGMSDERLEARKLQVKFISESVTGVDEFRGSA